MKRLSMGVGQCQRKMAMTVLAMIVAAALATLGCHAQSTTDAVAYLDNIEKEVRKITQNVVDNYVHTCDLVASCGNNNCSRQACMPLQGDNNLLTCKRVASNQVCNGNGCQQFPFSLKRSFVRLPNVALTLNEANYSICSQRMLDPTFQGIAQNHDSSLNLTSWTYFASVEGVHRAFPGRDVPATNCAFEPRERPWYKGAIAVTKDLMVLLDAGNSMGESLTSDLLNLESKFAAAVSIVSELLNTLVHGDRVTIVRFTSASAALVHQSLTATTGNATDLQPLKDALQVLTTDTNQGASNIEAAFQLANQTFEPQSSALKVILTFTDGQFTSQSLSTSILDSLVQQQVLIQFYSFDRLDTIKQHLSQVACYVNGTYERILESVANPLWTIRSYFGIIAMLRLRALGDNPYWTLPYPDDGSLGTVITVAYPAFAPDNYTLIGVAGIDVLMEELGSIAESAFTIALQDRLNTEPVPNLTPSPLPCNVQLSNLNQCQSVQAPSNPLCLKTDTSGMSFEQRVCTCQPECQPSSKRLTASQISGIGVGGGVFLLVFLAITFLTFLVIYRKSKHRGSGTSPATGSVVKGTTGDAHLAEMPRLEAHSLRARSGSWGSQANRDLIEYTEGQLQEATKNWSDGVLLGTGAHGQVYKGCFSDGKIVAIKKPTVNVEMACDTFATELELLSKLNHKCLVRLLGYCKDKRILIYEFMVNGNLSDCLHGKQTGQRLGWEERLRIAMGAAKGLEYLHEYAKPKIIHGDVKPANILLDQALDAHVSDFGLSLWSQDAEMSYLWASRMGGTLGYLDPEYASSGALTFGSDVYSFGMVLLELISGRRVVVNSINIGTWATELAEQGNVRDILDPSLEEPTNIETIYGLVELALDCVQQKRQARPKMKEVAAQLDGALTAWKPCNRIPEDAISPR